MENNLLFENNLNLYIILIGSGLIITYSLYHLILTNYAAIPSKNMEPFTNEEIEAIFNENATRISNENIDDYLTDSDSETDVGSDYESISDDESVWSDIDLDDLDLFFMPNVDFYVCSIQELKIFEISSIYYREIAEKLVTDEELMQLIYYFSEDDLVTNWINNYILFVISNL
jgi:hypothetical protein